MPLLYTLLPEEHPPDERYGAFAGPLTLPEVPTHLPRGALVAVRPRHGDEWNDIATAIDTTASRVVNASVVLWPDCVGRRRSVRLAALARLMGVRAVVWDGAPLTAMLRYDLTDPTDWPREAVLWVRRRGAPLDPSSAHLLEALAQQSAALRTLAAIIAGHGLGERAWRRLFVRAGLGMPGPWHAALRAVGIGIQVQRYPEQTLAQFAYQFGFSSGSSLSDRLHDVIGARPEFIRTRVGAAWMLADATRRLGIM
jgi:hypothetical protein